MARKAILETTYTFTPSTRTLVIPRAIPRERLILVTDVNTNQVIYNFSDPNLTATSYVIATSADGSSVTTTITFNYNTSGLSATDRLQILVDEYDEKVSPSDTYLDPLNKLRVSTPQAMIDADFEYSSQSTKWENLSLVNNRPFAFTSPTAAPFTISDITATNGSRTYVATVAATAGSNLLLGNAITITDTNYSGADGTYIIDTNPAATSFSYNGKVHFTGTTGSIYNANNTNAYFANIFSNTNIGISSIGFSSTLINVVTSVPHGLSPGNDVGLIGTAASTNAPNGSWTVATVSNATSFSFYTVAAPTGTITGGTLYARPLGHQMHRPWQAGIRFGHNTQSPNHQFVRQTRRYFRYQAGKGIQFSTGATLKSNFILDQLTSSGTTVTVATKDQHNIYAPGVGITIYGADQSAYNGNFTVTQVLDPYRFTYTAASTPTATQATGAYSGAINSWYGSATRVGLFDSQNGMFFEHDGQQLFAVRRSSTTVLTGNVTVTAGSATVTGFGTAFAKQLLPNDFIVIKGMSYRVRDILSDTTLTITPQYRGLTNIANTVVTKTVDQRIPQSQWNIDRCDGTGPSGFRIDLNKMQMFFIDYSWYGAGFVRWGFRGPDGNLIHCHRLVNNNVQQIAFMRSGNLPGRFETHSFANTTILASNVGATDTSITVSSIPTNWPPSGTLVIRNATAQEYVNYTTLNSATNVISGLTRGTPTVTQTVTATSGNAVVLTANTVNVQSGMLVTGTGIVPQTFVSSITANTNITLSYAPTAGGTPTLTFTALGSLAAAYTANVTAPIAVENHTTQFSAEMNQWGTAVVMDGGFNQDKAFVYTRNSTTYRDVFNGLTNAIMSFRVSPSASSGQPGGLGVRELINRSQLVPMQLDVHGNGPFLIQLVLNGTVSSSSPGWLNHGGTSLAQYQLHTANTFISGGETIYAFYVNGTNSLASGGPGNATAYSTTQEDISMIRELGTSILGGGQSSGNVAIYPDGPDVLTITATNLSGIPGSFANLVARFSWTEAQA